MLFKTSKKKVQTLLLQMDNKIIDKVLDFNFLGIHFNEQLNWKSHIDKLSVKGRCWSKTGVCHISLSIQQILIKFTPLVYCHENITNCEI